MRLGNAVRTTRVETIASAVLSVATSGEGFFEITRDVARFLQAARRLDLRKRPSISEAIDWARALTALGKISITDEVVATTLPVLFKTRSDMETARRHFLGAGTGPVENSGRR